MTTSYFPSIFVPLVGLVFPTITMASQQEDPVNIEVQGGSRT